VDLERLLLRHRGPPWRLFRKIRSLNERCRAQPPNGNAKWAILDSNQGPPPYQSGALTD
jgi:hypothetical protein